MALAKTQVGSLSPEWAAKIEFLQLAALSQPGDKNPNWASINNVRYTWSQVFGGPPIGAAHNYLTGTCPGMPPVTNTVWVNQMSGTTIIAGASEYTVCPFGNSGPFFLYGQRVTYKLPAALSFPCSPHHLALQYAWGSEDPYTVVLNNGMGGETERSHAALTPSWAASGGGTVQLPYGALTINLGNDATYFAMDSVSGVTMRVSEITWDGRAVEFPTFRDPVSGSTRGCHIEGGGDEITFLIDDFLAASLNSVSFSVVIYPPIVIDWDLIAYSWGQEIGATFLVPRNLPDESGSYYDKVVSPVREMREYYKYSSNVRSADIRPWELRVLLDHAATAEDQRYKEPSDLPCVIDGANLSMNPDEWWLGFVVAPVPELSLNNPTGTPTPPSEWVAQTEDILSVCTTGTSTDVHLGKACADQVIRRDLVEDYFSSYITPTGLGTYGLPSAYQFLKRQATSDVWNLENFSFLEITYTADSPQLLVLAIGYREVSIEDNHLTGSTRVTGFDFSVVSRTALYPFSMAAGEGQKTYIDLAYPDSPWLQHVDWLEIRGLSNPDEEQTAHVVLSDIKLVRMNPVTGAMEGKMDTKLTFSRPASTGTGGTSPGLPISYTGATFTADGKRAIRPPDQIQTLCGEAGLDFVERLTGYGTGIILDHLWLLSYWGTTLHRQEGVEVPGEDDDPKPWDTDSPTYEAAFVDDTVDKNDLLGGNLYCSDCIEQFDLVIDQSGTMALPIGVRVGYFCPATSYPFRVKVRKYLDGSIHSLVRNGRRQRYTKPIGIELHEVTTEEIDLDQLDDWSRVDFAGKGGVRETLGGYLKAASGGGRSATQQVWNKLRAWREIVVSALSDPSYDVDASGKLWMAYVDSGAVMTRARAHFSIEWEDDAVVNDTAQWARPIILCLDDGSMVIAAYDLGQQQYRHLVTDTRGSEWQEANMSIASGFTTFDMSQRAGQIVGAGWAEDAMWFVWSRDGGVTREPFGETDRRKIADAPLDENNEPPRPAVEVYGTGEIDVAFRVADELHTYVSDDGGTTWRAV